jgi:sugar phosphate permease
LVSKKSRRKKKIKCQKVLGRIYGFLSATGSLGDFLGRVGLGLMLKNIPSLTWRHSFWICAILILVVVILTAIPLKDQPSDVGLFVDTSEDKVDELEEEEKKPHPLEGKSLFGAILYILTSPRVYMILLAQTSMTAMFSFNEEYVPLYLVEVYKLDSGDAALYSSVCSICAVFGVLIGGFIYDSLINYPIIKMIYLVIGSMLSTVCMILIAVFEKNIPLPLSLIIFGFSFFILAPAYYLW